MKHGNPLLQLHELGQSVWLDYLRRGMLDDGSLLRMLRTHGLRGVTSNPSIFEEAIGDSDDYDEALDELADEGLEPGRVFERLAVADIRRATDVFREIYEESGGTDGFVSLEVSPELAYDTEGALEEARRLWNAVDRPNLMIKVPGTDAGIPAVEQLLSEGLNINITLLFSREGHQRVMDAYLKALERRLEAGNPLDRISSVASFFVSRVDSAVDDRLQARLEEADDEATRERIRSLLGTIAIANAKLAYQQFRDTFSGDRFVRLRERGAQLQRPLWASTSAKNPDYRDVLYVEELIGPDTVNTMPVKTLEAFLDHGEVARTIDRGVEQAEEQLRTLAEVGVDLDEVTEQLQREGVDKFAKSYDELLECVDSKMARLAGRS
ncbi:MAG: transaldolase [Longimicrobiaceae bacterium]